jgi:transaldolase
MDILGEANMEIWIDTANIEEIKEAKSWGIISGVTTNTTKIAQEKQSFRELIDEICKIMENRPVSVMAVQHEYKSAEEIVKDAHELVEWHSNIVVKIPPTIEGFKAIKILSEEGIKTNVTLVYSPSQALLAAKVGATYVSPFVGRLDYVSHEGMKLVRDIKTIYDNYGFKTKIVVAAARHPLHVVEAALIGAHIATAAFDILKMLYNHPLTDVGLKTFLEDWKKVKF